MRKVIEFLIREAVELMIILLPILFHRRDGVVGVVVDNGNVHAPRKAVGAVPPVVCNQRKCQPIYWVLLPLLLLLFQTSLYLGLEDLM